MTTIPTSPNPFRPETRGDNSRTSVPDPGIYRDVPMGQYHAWDAASNTKLGKILRSPAHLWAHLNEPQEDTAATLAGRAIHCAVLEPDLFPTLYLAAEECGAYKKGGDRAKCTNDGKYFHPSIGWRCGVHPDIPVTLEHGPTILKPVVYGTCLKVRDELHVHSTAAPMLAAATDRELSLVWDHRNGSAVRCKARPDAIAPIDGGTIIDLKKTTNAGRYAFERAIFKYGYHRQGALYGEAAQANGIEVKNFMIIAIEDYAPFACAAYRISNEAIKGGWTQLETAFTAYRECKKTGLYPGYDPLVTDIGLPSWAWDQLDETSF